MHRWQKRKQPTTPDRTGRLYLGGHHFIPLVRFPGVLPPFKPSSVLPVAPAVVHVFSETVRDLIVVRGFADRLFDFNAGKIFETRF
jgi:hypothetical protein